eukprot:25068-Rhodomonas_salina.1
MSVPDIAPAAGLCQYRTSHSDGVAVWPRSVPGTGLEAVPMFINRRADCRRPGSSIRYVSTGHCVAAA